MQMRRLFFFRALLLWPLLLWPLLLWPLLLWEPLQRRWVRGNLAIAAEVQWSSFSGHLRRSLSRQALEERWRDVV
ncbi:hypothetical protein C8J98_110159 [Luteibacter sp. OK325]|nr:hypothetical protein C8J98_110159 [Luteibacter sp. OK325]